MSLKSLQHFPGLRTKQKQRKTRKPPTLRLSLHQVSPLGQRWWSAQEVSSTLFHLGAFWLLRGLEEEIAVSQPLGKPLLVFLSMSWVGRAAKPLTRGGPTQAAPGSQKWKQRELRWVETALLLLRMHWIYCLLMSFSRIVWKVSSISTCRKPLA